MVNYKKSIIYKLCCKDPSIPDEYIGSTTNKNRRKQQHKENSNGQNKNKYNYPVYQFIRENGGFDNWTMIILEEYSCESKIQLCQREREWIEEMKPTLNRKTPIITEEERLERNRQNSLSRSRTDEVKEKRKEYEKTDERREYKKKYREDNIEAIKENQKIFYENNKDILINNIIQKLYNINKVDVKDIKYTISGYSYSKINITVKQSIYHMIIEPLSNSYDKYIIQEIVQEYARSNILNIFSKKIPYKIIIINKIDNIK